MATDLEKLVVQLSADIRGFEKELNRALGLTDKMARGVETRARGMQKRLDGIMKGAGRSLINPLAGIGGGLLAGVSLRAVQLYADAWTIAGNKIAAAGQVAGRQGRSLEGINEIARRSRAGISETADLYAKLLRATAGVAKSEEEVARATEIVSKSFSAGGAAASEQAAGLLQLGQALASGMFQGDELRSIRENAPLLAKTIADEFKTTVGGLKELGSAGQLEVGRVFKAILAGQTQIEAAFARTNPTIQNGITAVNNAMTQYIGQSDKSLGASQRLVGGLIALADNFDTVADTTLKFAALIASALIGRSIAVLISKVPLAAVAVLQLATAMRTAAAAGGAMAGIRLGLLGAAGAAGPLGLAIGTVAAAAVILSNESETAEDRLARVRDEMQKLGLISDTAAGSIKDVAGALNEVSAAQSREEVRKLQDDIAALRDDLSQAAKEVAGVFGAGKGGFITTGTAEERAITKEVRDLVTELINGKTKAEDVIKRLDEIARTPVSQGMDAFLIRAREIVAVLGAAIRRMQQLNGVTPSGGSFAIPVDPREKAIEDFRKAGDFFKSRNLDAARSEIEVEIDNLAKTIKKAADDAGVQITDAAARLQATREVIAKEVKNSGLLSIISKGESAGNPNATVFNGKFTGGEQLSLVQMTLKEILALQTKMLASPLQTPGRKTSAVGEFQITKQTLEDFIGRLNLSLDEKFTPALQKTIAEAIVASTKGNPEALRGRFKSLKGFSNEQLTQAFNNDASVIAQGNEALERRDEILKQLSASGQDEVSSLQLEAQAMQLSTFEAEKLRREHELLAAAKQAGITLTVQERAAIEQQAIAYANAKVAIEDVAKAQEKAAQTAEQLRQAQEQAAQTMQAVEGAFAGSLKGFISDLINGASLTEALTNALTDLADQLVSIALDNLFSGLFSSGTGGGGLLAGLFHAGSTAAGTGGTSRRVSGALFAGAPRYHSGGIAGLKPGEIPAILKRGEPIGPAAVDAAARRLIAIGGLRAVSQNQRQGVSVTNNFTIQDERVMLRSQNQIAARAADSLRRAARVA